MPQMSPLWWLSILLMILFTLMFYLSYLKIFNFSDSKKMILSSKVKCVKW